MDDLISRQAAIDALYHVDEYNGRSVEAIRNLPPAQAEERTNKHTETLPCDLQPTCNQLATDTISRQAAIRIASGYCHPANIAKELAKLPSAQSIPTKTEDLIRRGDAIEAIYRRIKQLGLEYDADVLSIRQAVREVPSAQPSGKDPIEREAVVEILHDAMQGCSESEENLIGEIVCKVDLLPSAQPYTEDEIQKIQDLEQAQLDKMYELGKQTAQAEIIHCRECKHWKTNHPTANGYHCCHRIHNVFPMREDDFCSRAERRKND